MGTGLATPSGCDRGEILCNKAKGFGVELGAVTATWGVTTLWKEASGKTRPNGHDDRSMPSGHASFTASLGALTWRNSDALCTSRLGRTAIKTAATGLTLGTAWARVEGGRHFPSDVLAGYALGNFTSLFLHDTFLGRAGWQLGAGWKRDPGMVTLSLSRDL